MSFLSAAILAFVFATNLVILKTDFDCKRIPNAFVLFLFITSLGWHGVLWNNGISVDYVRFFLMESFILLGSFGLFWFGLFSAGDAKYFIALSLFATESYETAEFLRNVAIATILFSLGHTAVALLRKRGPEIALENPESGMQNVPSMKDELIRFLVYSCVVWAFGLWRGIDSDDWSSAFSRLAIFGIGYAFVRTIMRKYAGVLVKTEMMKTNLDELTVGTVIAPRYVKRKWNQLSGNDTDFPKTLDSLTNPLDSQGLDILRRSFPRGTELLTVRTHAFSPVIFTGFVMGFIFWPNTATIISSIFKTQ